MFLIKIFKFLKGYVIITLRGFFIERFINICIRRNIKLWDIKKTSPSFAVMKISKSDFKKIRQIARKTHTKIKIKQKCGLKYFIGKYKKRYALFIGIFIFAASCILIPQFIWIVDMDGCVNIDKQEMLGALRDAGVYPGAYKGTMKQPQQIRDIIMNRFDNVTWAWIYINGSRALMKVEEKPPVPKLADETVPGNITAAKDCVISKLTVKEGRAAVIPGDAVMAGDVVITGEVEMKDGAVRYVHALGEAEAYTYYSQSQDVKLYDEVRIPTGKKKSFYTLNIFSKNISLFLPRAPSFSEYDTEHSVYNLPFDDKVHLPVSLSRTRVSEVDAVRIDISEKNASDRAREAMEESISKKILPQSELINKNTYTEKIDDETLRVYVQMEFKEQIGLFQPIQTEESAGTEDGAEKTEE